MNSTTSQIKVSVLMPIYQTDKKHLREAIQSILDQTFTNFEFLIINDSPEDHALDSLVEEFQRRDARIHYTKNAHNEGITPSRNKLIEQARGEYLAVMDHDDISLPQRFERQVAFLDAHSDYGVVGSYIEEFPHRKIVTKPVENHDIELSLMTSCAIHHPASMIRRQLLLDHHLLYEEQFSPAEDYALWCRLLPHTKFYNIAEVLLLYRVHQHNTSKTQKGKMQRATLAIYAFVKRDNPALYATFEQVTSKITRVKLFSLIPLLTICDSKQSVSVRLFGFIPILSYKTRLKHMGSR